MKLRQFMVGVVAATLGISGVAHAGQFSAEDLGQSLPMWMETLASINAHGDVAWTAWDGTATTAKFYNAANDHVLSTTEAESWAVSITDHVPDGGSITVGIAGSHASSQRLTDRSAVLWRVSWPTNSETASSQLLDLGATTDKLDDSEGTVQQSAAYAVLEKTGGGTARDFYVGGFARDKVNKSTFPQPVIWEISNAFTGNESIEVHPLPLSNPGAIVPSGYVASIAKNEDQGTVWACGNTSGAGDYNQATCWNLSGGIAGASVHTQMTTDLASTGGLGAVPASSMVHRVRVVPIGPNGELHTVAVGSALMGGGKNRSWKGWAYDLDAGVLYKDLGLTGSTDHETFAYDVAALEYENGTATPSKGMIIAGISSSTAASEIGGLPGNIHNVPTTMRGVNRRMMLSGVTDTGQVCAIQDDSEDLQGTYQQLLALSADGRYRLATQGNQLVRLSAVVDAAEVEIRNRDATRKAHYDSSRSSERYFQAQSVFSSRTPVHAVLQLGENLACGLVSEAFPVSAYTTSNNAAFDIENKARIGLSPIAGGSNVLRSVKQPGELFDVGTNHYAQIAIKDGDDCTVTPVYSIDTIVVKDDEALDFDGDQWTWCDPDKWVDTDTDYDHCGICDLSALDRYRADSGYSNKLSCVRPKCDGGDWVRDKVLPNYCQIGGDYGGECITENTIPELVTIPPNSQSAEPDAINFCKACKSASNSFDWTNQNIACCNNGVPQITVWAPRQNGTNIPYVRPTTTGGNIGYTGSGLGVGGNRNRATLINANWVTRIQEISDGNLWTFKYGSGCGSGNTTPHCYPKGDKNKYGVQTLTSHLTGEADQEDWFVFRNGDYNHMNEQESEPRVRILPSSGQVELCVFPRCLQEDSGTGTRGGHYWTNANHRREWNDRLGYHVHQGSGGGRVGNDSSPVHDGATGVGGYCVTSSGNGQPADIEILVAGQDKILKRACWNHDVFVRVRTKPGTPLLMCGDEYRMLWGNDRAYVQSNSNYIWPVEWGCNDGWSGTTCLDCCDAPGQAFERTPGTANTVTYP